MSAGELVRADAVETTRVAGKEFVAMEQASRDVGLLLAIIKWLVECSGESLERDDQLIADEIATDYGQPRWAANY